MVYTVVIEASSVEHDQVDKMQWLCNYQTSFSSISRGMVLDTRASTLGMDMVTATSEYRYHLHHAMVPFLCASKALAEQKGRGIRRDSG